MVVWATVVLEVLVMVGDTAAAVWATEATAEDTEATEVMEAMEAWEEGMVELGDMVIIDFLLKTALILRSAERTVCVK